MAVKAYLAASIPILNYWSFTFGRKMEEELSEELELQIKGAEKPSFWELIGVRFILLPYTLGKVIFPYFDQIYEKANSFTGSSQHFVVLPFMRVDLKHI